MNPDLEDIKSRALYQQGGPNPAQVLIHESDFNYLLIEVNRLRKESAERQQAGLDLCDENERLARENSEQAQRMKEIFLKVERLEKLVPPESERGPGFVGQGSWSVYAEKVVAERDEARDDLNTLCEDIRCLKEEYDDFKSAADERIQELREDNSALADDNWQLQEKVKRLGEQLAAKKEHTNVHFNSKDDFVGITGYGQFSLKQVDKDRWEIHLLEEKVTLYNKKGHRVRGHHNHDGDW